MLYLNNHTPLNHLLQNEFKHVKLKSEFYNTLSFFNQYLHVVKHFLNTCSKEYKLLSTMNNVNVKEENQIESMVLSE